MAGGGDNGVLLGMTAANQARRAGGSKGGSSMFNVIPLLIIPVIVYSVLVIFTGGEPSAAAALMDNTVFQVPLVSGPWGMKVGDLLIIFALIMMFIELVKSTYTSSSTLVDHGLSMVVFIICLVEFLLAPQAATSTFFLLMVASAIDVIAGFTIGIRVARRDLAIGADH